MTTLKNIFPTSVGTFSPDAQLISAAKIIVRHKKRKVEKGKGATLSYDDLRKIATASHPPQAWFDETNG